MPNPQADARKYLLGIETSCDDTGVAVLDASGKVLANELLSQIDFHQVFNGVVPEIASRKHFETIHTLLDRALSRARITWKDLEGVACTIGPGLVGSLLVGVCTGKAIAAALKIPFIPVNHLIGHIYANFLTNPDLKPPFIILLVSGGHTDLYAMIAPEEIRYLGGTLDDAAGEAFDKGARILGLPYPGGPSISKAAEEGNPLAIRFPRPLKKEDSLDFSFSGLKTALLYYMRKHPDFPVSDAAASYQEAITDILIEKTFLAGRQTGFRKIVFAGGVSANRVLRKKATERASQWGYTAHFPNVEDCTDNAAMIARAGWHSLLNGAVHQPNVTVDSSLTIEKTLATMKDSTAAKTQENDKRPVR